MKFLEITYFKGLHCKKWHFTPHSTSKAPAGLTLSPAYHTKKKRRFIVLNRAMTFHQWLRQISMKLLLLTPLFYWHKVILIVIELI